MAFGKIKIDPRDKLFSLMIRERDKHTCVFCGKKKEEVSIQNSHFWGRGCKSLRFEPLNCDALCFYCHYKNEGNKQTEYREWKIKQLGIKKYNELEKIYRTGYKAYGKFEKEKLLNILKEQYKNKEHLKKNWKVIW